MKIRASRPIASRTLATKKDECAAERQLQVAPLPRRSPPSLVSAAELAASAAAIQAMLGGQGGAPLTQR
jgi:hypothetical protein